MAENFEKNAIEAVAENLASNDLDPKDFTVVCVEMPRFKERDRFTYEGLRHLVNAMPSNAGTTCALSSSLCSGVAFGSSAKPRQ